VNDEEISNEHFVITSSQAAKRNVNEFGSSGRERTQRFPPSGFCPEKKPAKESGAGEAKESRVYLGSRSETGNALCLLAVHDAYDREFAH
jgi:hypothetical protein